jgi:hypothetical protein
MQLKGPTLQITGDALNNHVVVRQVGNTIRVTALSVSAANQNGLFLVNPGVTQTKVFNAASVHKILFFGNDGNDSFINLTSIRAAAFGGQGNDDLTAGMSGKDYLSGGGGFDVAHLLVGKGTTDTEVVDLTNLPDGNAQPSSSNTCGPNSAWRVLNAYGSRATLQSVIDRAAESSIVARWNLGTTGATLANAMNFSRVGMKKAHTFSLKTHSSLDSLLAELAQGRPVVAMIAVSGNANAGGSGGGLGGVLGGLLNSVSSVVTYRDPGLHWIALDGFDRQHGIIFYHQTDGVRYPMSMSDFQGAWNWNVGYATNLLLQGLGVVPGTYIV